jgi:hypothetical protein
MAIMGRGRGTPNDDIWELSEAMAEQKRQAPPKTKKQAREKNRVEPGGEAMYSTKQLQPAHGLQLALALINATQSDLLSKA